MSAMMHLFSALGRPIDAEATMEAGGVVVLRLRQDADELAITGPTAGDVQGVLWAALHSIDSAVAAETARITAAAAQHHGPSAEDLIPRWQRREMDKPDVRSWRAADDGLTRAAEGVNL